MAQRAEQEAQGNRPRKLLGSAIDLGAFKPGDGQEEQLPPLIGERDGPSGHKVADLVEAYEEDGAWKKRQHKPNVSLDSAELAAARVHRVEEDEQRHRRPPPTKRASRTRSRKLGAPRR